MLKKRLPPLEPRFSYAETDLLAKSAEEESLVDSMRQDAVQGIIRRLQALKPETVQAPINGSQATEPHTTAPDM